MSKQYHHLEEAAERLHGKIGEHLDDKGHGHAQELLHQAHRLVQDMRLDKRPRSIEDSIKSIVGTLQNMRREGDQVMDFRHIDMFITSYQQMQMSLRKFPNY